MSPAFKYSYGRLGLFLLCMALLWPTPLNILVKVMLALLVSAVLGFFLLRKWRNQMGEQLSSAAAHRTAEKMRLRAALAGDEDAAAEGDRVAAATPPASRLDEDDDEREEREEAAQDSKSRAILATNMAKASNNAAASAVDAVKAGPSDDHDVDTPAANGPVQEK